MEHNISLSQYRIFYTVARTGNISKAADVLFISQPAVSKSLKQLEDNLGTRLLTRGSRGVVLTKEGQIIYEHLMTAFNEIEKAEDIIFKNQEIGLGSITISVSSTLCKYMLLPYLKEFIKLNPHIKINIECRSTTYSLQLLDSGKADIGLIGKTDNQRNLEFLSIGKVNYIFTATENYINNLNARDIFSTTDIFENANIMLLDNDNVSRLHINKFLTGQNLIPKNILEVNNMDLLIDFAKIDMGIACVISDFIEKDLEKKRLIEIPLPAKIPPREIGFAYNRNCISSAAMEKFILFIKNKINL